MSNRRRQGFTARVADALTGVLAALAGMAVGHLVGGLTDPAASPVLAVGSTVIDATPTPVKEWAVAHFGSADKLVLLSSVTVVTVLLAATAGLLSRRRPALGVGFVVLLAALATAAALTRPVTVAVDALPGAAAALVGIVVLLGLRPLRWGRQDPGGLHGAGPAAGYPSVHDGRRHFLIGAGAVALGAAGVAAFGQRLAGTGGAGAGVLPGMASLPAPADPAPPLPAGLERQVRGISPLRTSNAAFYRVDTALAVPRVNPDTWRLRVDGELDTPLTLSLRDLLAMPLIERDITMTCVSNEVGGGYIGASRWLGVRLAALLDRVGVHPGADQLLSTAVDGFTISTPMGALTDGRDAMIAIGMNGQPLPAVHGFPARLITPGVYGFVGATKWLTRLTATTYARDRAYWTRRGWATDAPIKTSSRIDTPRPLSTISAGRTAIGGVAWAQHRGIKAVQVKVDDGPWQPVTLGPDVGVDYWRQWYLPWQATPGRHSISVRAIDRTGAVQSATRATPFPDGSSGLQDVVVFVT